MRPFPTLLFLFLSSVGTNSHAQAQYQSTVLSEQSRNGDQQIQRMLDTQAFIKLQRSAAAQSKAVTEAAAKAPQNYADNLLAPGIVDRVAEETGAMNRKTTQAVGEKQILLAKLSLPGLDQISSDIKYGKYITVSAKGKETILFIRKLVNSKEKEKIEALQNIQMLAKQGVPEAAHFLGFMFEYGLFGASRNIEKAVDYYRYAGTQNYQPALYNLANIMFLGKYGKGNLSEAEVIAKKAYSLGSDSSSRICGLAAFMSYRKNNKVQSLKYGERCFSPLSNIPNAAYLENIDINSRIKMLRDSIAAGADDGYGLLEKITRTLEKDHNYLHCKYKVVSYLHFSKDSKNVLQLAQKCLTERGVDTIQTKASEMNVVGITGFASVESDALKKLRQFNKYHYSWSVPYLPFSPTDIEMFETILPKEKK